MSRSDYFPPVITEFYRWMKADGRLYYFGSFGSWDEANKAAEKYGKAYEADNIIGQVADAIQAVRKGEAVFEQDGVLFYEENNIYEFLASLFYILLHCDKLGICDMGGSLGSTYFRYRHLLPMDRISWNVVEQKHYVDYGKDNIPEIDFYYSIEECFDSKGDINVVLLLSVLPYLEDPYGMLDRIYVKKPKYIIIDETVCNIDDNEEEHIVLQHVPASIYEATYPSHIFNRKKMMGYFENAGYRKVFEWDYPVSAGEAIPTRIKFGFKKNVDKGFLFEYSEKNK